jgi:hypothetical protein
VWDALIRHNIGLVETIATSATTRDLCAPNDTVGTQETAPISVPSTTLIGGQTANEERLG